MTRVSRNINHFRPLVLENKYSFVFDITLTPFIKNCITFLVLLYQKVRHKRMYLIVFLAI